jgi:protein gp37
MENTHIQWADHTFNPWIGCTKVAPGCAHCYAEADMDKRRHRVKWGPNGTRSRTTDDYWRQPLKWEKAAAFHNAEFLGREKYPRVFCGSLNDWAEDWDGPIVDAKGRQLFHHPEHVGAYQSKDVGEPPVTMDDLRRDLFSLIDKTPNLTWLLLTKRISDAKYMIPVTSNPSCTRCQGDGCDAEEWLPFSHGMAPHPCRDCIKRDNLWLGTSISDQETADAAVLELLKCRDLAAKLFLSLEPMLGPVDLSPWIETDQPDGACPVCGEIRCEHGPAIDWVIVGGESGPNARPCKLAWIEDIVGQCREAGVSCFVKQWGANAEETHGCHRKAKLRDPKGGDPSEWPERIRLREVPK